MRTIGRKFLRISRLLVISYVAGIAIASCVSPAGPEPSRPEPSRPGQPSPSTVESASSRSFYWGAVGHNDWPQYGPSYAYNRVSLSTQMRLLREAGLNAYRSGCGRSSCAALFAGTKSAGVTVLGVLDDRPDDHLSEADNYQKGYKFAAQSVTAYQGGTKYFEAGNEIEDWVGVNGDGAVRANYKQDRYEQARGLIKGLIDGAHAADPKALVMVDDAGWCHYGFLQSLWEDGVRWDITAIHWYSSQGNFEKAGCRSANVAQIHAAFGRPVWITEFNSNEAAKNGDGAAAAAWLVSFIDQVRQVSAKYNIHAAFIYELLDEPNLKGMESHFGIADGDGSPKPAYPAVAGRLTK
jgi:Glycosyl hydrolase catalytic core